VPARTKNPVKVEAGRLGAFVSWSHKQDRLKRTQPGRDAAWQQLLKSTTATSRAPKPRWPPSSLEQGCRRTRPNGRRSWPRPVVPMVERRSGPPANQGAANKSLTTTEATLPPSGDIATTKTLRRVEVETLTDRIGWSP
jgi:hypothetical protein